MLFKKYYFVVIFYRPKWEEGERAETGGQKITPKQIIVLNLIRQTSWISRRDIAKKLHINESVVRKHLDALKAKGVIKRVGPDKGGHWEILE